MEPLDAALQNSGAASAWARHIEDSVFGGMPNFSAVLVGIMNMVLDGKSSRRA